MAEFQELAVTGELVMRMPESERWFEIIEEPIYENIPTPQDPEGKKKQKLSVPVRLSNGSRAMYYPNKTSGNRIATISMSTDMTKWVGQKFLWGTIVKQNVAGQMKDIIYVTEAWPRVAKAP